jgi:hypothetical protein
MENKIEGKKFEIYFKKWRAFSIPNWMFWTMFGVGFLTTTAGFLYYSFRGARRALDNI